MQGSLHSRQTTMNRPSRCSNAQLNLTGATPKRGSRWNPRIKPSATLKRRKDAPKSGIIFEYDQRKQTCCIPGTGAHRGKHEGQVSQDLQWFFVGCVEP